jgi:hypothetical protein
MLSSSSGKHGKSLMSVPSGKKQGRPPAFAAARGVQFRRKRRAIEIGMAADMVERAFPGYEIAYTKDFVCLVEDASFCSQQPTTSFVRLRGNLSELIAPRLNHI